MVTPKHAADSRAQRGIEKTLLERLRSRKGWSTVSWKELAASLGLPTALQKAKPDAVWKTDGGRFVIAECYVRVGKGKPGNFGKLAKDALKLAAIRNSMPVGYDVTYLIVLPEQTKLLSSKAGWFPDALSLFAEIELEPLLPEEQRLLGEATIRQADGQRPKPPASSQP